MYQFQFVRPISFHLAIFHSTAAPRISLLNKQTNTQTHTKIHHYVILVPFNVQIPIECQLDTLIPTTDLKGKEIDIHSHMFLLEQCTGISMHLYTRRFNLAAVYLIYVYIYTYTYIRAYIYTHTQVHIYIYVKTHTQSPRKNIYFLLPFKNIGNTKF